MKSIFSILKIEICQNRLQVAAVMIFSFLAGLMLMVAEKAYQKVSQLVKPVEWSADLVIMPKGLTLQGLAQEILEAKTTHFLPLALFDTTIGLVEDRVQLSALLVRSRNGKPLVQFKGVDGLGWNWARPDVEVIPWEEQKEYTNPDWGNQVITAFFAKGSMADLNHLKEIIDRKTVAQSFWIQDIVKSSIDFQNQVMSSLVKVSLVFIVMLLVGFSVSGLWFLEQYFETQRVLSEIGFTKKDLLNLKIYLILIVFAPSVLGILLGLGITI